MNTTINKAPIVSIQGYVGSFHHVAALELLDRQEVPLLERNSFSDVFNDLNHSRCDLAVVAVHNSTVGALTEVQHLLDHHKPQVIAQLDLPIKHHLIGTPDGSISSIKSVQSHPIALAQCQRFLHRHSFITKTSTDTALSVREITQQARSSQAAIGSSLAAQLHGGKILAPDIQDLLDNKTTFLLIRKAQK